MPHLMTLPGDSLVFDWKKAGWLYLHLIPSVCLTWYAMTPVLGLVSLGLTVLTVGLGHSAGLHRGIIHRSYQTSRFMRGMLAYLAVQTGLGSPLKWLQLHYLRDYWQNRSDTPRYFQYEHDLLTDYHWYLHLSYRPASWDRYQIPPEDLEDTWLIWLDKTWRLHVLGAALLVWLVAGWEAVVMLVSLRISLITLGHWFIGFYTHKYGYSRYHVEGADVSGNNDWLLGVISFGEGFHNNHHAYPQSARMGIRWYEFDVSWYLISLLQRLGLVWEVKEAEKQAALKPTARKHSTTWNWPWRALGR